jgi:hypothetical protein
MRFSSLVVAAVLLVPAALLAQHSSGAGGSSSGGYSGASSSGASHSSYSGGSSSSASSASSHNSSSSASHVASTGAAASHPSPSTKLPSTKENAAPEKKGFRPFLRHPFKKPKPVQTAEFKRPPCRKEPCAVCPPGESRNGKGGCVPSVVASNVCQPGQFWNGFACGARYFVNDCSALAAQLAQQERQMRSALTAQQQSCSLDSAGQECADLRGQSGGESLRYRRLQEQYEQCLENSHPYAFRGTSLPGASWAPRDDY